MRRGARWTRWRLPEKRNNVVTSRAPAGASRLHEIKPHISVERARAAVQELDEIVVQARQLPS
jgi:hypothetical protein